MKGDNMFITSNNFNTASIISFKATPQKTVVLAKRKISEQLKNGKKPPEIAQMYNLSVRRIYDLIKKYKLLPPQKAFHKSVEDSVIPLAKEGHSQKFISEKTGVKGVDIRKALQKNGLDLRIIRKQKFEEMVKSGASDFEIAEKLDIKLSSVASMRAALARKNGIDIGQKKYDPWRLRRNKNGTSLRNEFAKMIQAGKTVPQIAQKFNISIKTVYNYLRKLGIPHPQKQKSLVRKPLEETVETLAKQGFPLKFIIEQTGLYRKKINAILEAKGIDFKVTRKETLERLFAAGATNEEIATAMKKTVGSVRKARAGRNIMSKNYIKERRMEYAFERHLQGDSIKKIASDLKVTDTTIRNYLREYK